MIIVFRWQREDCLLCKPLQVKVREVLLLKEMKMTSVYFSSKYEINHWHGVGALSDTLKNRASNQGAQQLYI